MHHVSSTTTVAATHQIYASLLRLAGRGSANVAADCTDDASLPDRDRGAVSLEQVLWFVAAGVSVAVIAAILWGQIRDTAEEPITPPEAP